MKQKKSTIKFLKNAKKANQPGKQKGNKPGAPAKKFHKKPNKPRKDESDDEGDDDESESDKADFKAPKAGGVNKHKDELKGLEDADPEFFNYLKQNDASLLDFGASDDEEDDQDDDNEGDEDELDGDDSDEDDADSEDEPVYSKRQKKQAKGKIEVTVELIDSIVKNTLAGSIPETKKLLSIFRTACNPSGEDNLSADRDDDEKQISRYMILSPDVYEHAMLSAIGTLSKAFKLHLDLKDNANKHKLETLSKHPKWKKLQLLVLSFFKSILHTLEGLADNAEQAQVSIYLIESLEAYVPFLSPLPRLAKGVIKVLLNIWSFIPTVEGGSVQDTFTVRGHAFLRIRQMALLLPGAIGEECFRAIYLKFARQCKSFTEMNGSSVTFMSQCVAELYASDPAMAYQQSFLYIRQLALHVRTSFLKKSAETTRQITSWQFLNCLRLWTRVICSMPSETEGLGALAFPLAQIMFGVISLSTSIYFVPLKFHLVACLHQLAANCKLFIPAASQILEVLDCGDLVSKSTPSTDLAPKLQYIVKLPTDSINKVPVRDVIVQEAINLLRQECEIYRFHVGFPEYTYLTGRKLKAFSKKSKIAKWRDISKTVTGLIEQYSAYVKKMRVKLGKAPMSITEFEPLLPGAPNGTGTSSVRLNKLLNSKVNVANEVSVSASLPKSSGGVTPGSMKDTYTLSKTSKKSKNDSDKNNKKRRSNDSDSEGHGSGSDSDDDEDEIDDDDDNSEAGMEESDGGSQEDEDADEDSDGDEVPDNIDQFQDSVGDLNWADE